ncbi:hypothetical protein [Actinomadura rayongensis]|uniref:DUF4267 domain-containing protein n=1 Tax=Actinomadura rayongensis TaxID=1429076 RepID=A0A6I4W616_9ACTN|nr:hypothetical protein [Actinomadura rayongensis]
MADEKEDTKRDRADVALKTLAQARIGLGVAAFTAPALSARLLGLGGADNPARDYALRLFGAREIGLGAGYLLGKGPSRKAWARYGLAADVLDTVAGLKGRGRLPLWSVAAVVALSGGAAALGAATVARDVVR